ncbi:transcriptional regulator, IclR family [Rhizobiales bacterium GAS191]|nr:transcriptional regulator, IclR family [Rhizobiales bacterium GAS113]SEE32146.1 transcriptional regulator, IclR family [Rhizobiales bacterium GAS191]
MQDRERPRSQIFVTAFARGLAVIQAFEGSRQPLSLAEIAARAGVDRAVARRSLLTLIELGFAVMERKHYRLAPAVLRLGYSYLSQCGMDGVLQPFVERVARQIGESCSVTILDGLETVSVAHAPSPIHKMGFLSTPGTRMPAYVMTSGRVLLAGRSDPEVREALGRMDRKAYTAKTVTDLARLAAIIRETRQAGFTSIDSELEEGLLSIAVAIRNRRGDIAASLNVSSSATRTSIAALSDTALPIMRETAAEIGKILP